MLKMKVDETDYALDVMEKNISGLNDTMKKNRKRKTNDVKNSFIELGLVISGISIMFSILFPLLHKYFDLTQILILSTIPGASVTYLLGLWR